MESKCPSFGRIAALTFLVSMLLGVAQASGDVSLSEARVLAPEESPLLAPVDSPGLIEPFNSSPSFRDSAVPYPGNSDWSLLLDQSCILHHPDDERSDVSLTPEELACIGNSEAGINAALMGVRGKEVGSRKNAVELTTSCEPLNQLSRKLIERIGQMRSIWSGTAALRNRVLLAWRNWLRNREKFETDAAPLDILYNRVGKATTQQELFDTLDIIRQWVGFSVAEKLGNCFEYAMAMLFDTLDLKGQAQTCQGTPDHQFTLVRFPGVAGCDGTKVFLADPWYCGGGINEVSLETDRAGKVTQVVCSDGSKPASLTVGPQGCTAWLGFPPIAAVRAE